MIIVLIFQADTKKVITVVHFNCSFILFANKHFRCRLTKATKNVQIFLTIMGVYF